MKKFLLFIMPLFVALLIFIPVVIFLNLKSGKGAFQVTSVPQSNVYLNGKLIGKTPLCKCEGTEMLSVGDYTMKLIPVEGNFPSFEQKITIYKSVLTVVDRTFAASASSEGSIISLTPISDKNNSQLSLISFPDKVQVSLDNSPVGFSPLLLKNVADSDHQLTLKKEGYKDKILRVRAAKGYKLTTIIYLGISTGIASQSAIPQASSSAVPVVPKVLILETPTGFLRVRDSASLAGVEITQVKPGDTFDLVSEEQGWFQIKLSDGKNGWISYQYAKKQ